MKKQYEKPEVYSEKLAIDSLRAQCCREIDDMEAMPMPPEIGCTPACNCMDIMGPS